MAESTVDGHVIEVVDHRGKIIEEKENFVNAEIDTLNAIDGSKGLTEERGGSNDRGKRIIQNAVKGKFSNLNSKAEKCEKRSERYFAPKSKKLPASHPKAPVETLKHMPKDMEQESCQYDQIRTIKPKILSPRILPKRGLHLSPKISSKLNILTPSPPSSRSRSSSCQSPRNSPLSQPSYTAEASSLLKSISKYDLSKPTPLPSSLPPPPPPPPPPSRRAIQNRSPSNVISCPTPLPVQHDISTSGTPHQPYLSKELGEDGNSAGIPPPSPPSLSRPNDGQSSFHVPSPPTFKTEVSIRVQPTSPTLLAHLSEMKHSQIASPAPPPPPPPPPLKGRAPCLPTAMVGQPPPPPPPLPPVAHRGVPPPPRPPMPHGGALPPLPTRRLQGTSPPPPGTHLPSPHGPPRAPVVPPPPLGGVPSRLSLTSHSKSNGSGLPRVGGISSYTSTSQGSKLKPLHWIKVTRAVQGSLWAELQNCDDKPSASDFDISELESLFSTALPKFSNVADRRKSLGSKPNKVQLIDLRRANNCEIMLTKVKMSFSDMMSAVLTMDESILDVDQVEILLKFCPTKDEMDLLKSYRGDKENLGKCEQFFLHLLKVPRVESKLRVFLFKIQFISQISDFRKNLNIVNSASEELRVSVKLKEIMKKILLLGNTLNQGTARGSAIGFRLDSLLKLSDTRATNNRTTLMHYLCKVVASKAPHLLDFHEDLASLVPASKIQLKSLAEEMQAISKGLEKVGLELNLSEDDGGVSECFCKALKEFVAVATAEVQSVTSLYSAAGRNADLLSLYFGEDPARCPFEQVVATILIFVQIFRRAHEENCKQAELQRKKAQKEAEMQKAKATNPARKHPRVIRSSLCFPQTC